MKKTVLVLSFALLAACLFVICVSAATPNMYIEFGARFPGSDEYITVYTENAESKGNPQINFATKKFYSDIEFTHEVDMSTATGIDFSVTKSYVGGSVGAAPNRMTKPSKPFVNCVEVKWFLAGFPTVSYNGGFFSGWTGLKYFDFGNATAINDNTFENTGFESITIPATVTKVYGSSFKDCKSLKSVTFEGNLVNAGNGSVFYGCTELETVDLGLTTAIGVNMFYGCTSLETVKNLSKVISIEKQGFYGCTQLSSVSFGEATSIGVSAFAKSGITSVTIHKDVTSIGNEAFANCKSLTSVVFEDGFCGTLGSSAFMGTSALTTLVLAEGITSIPSQCFWSTGPVESVTLPDSVKILANRAFNSTGIKEFIIRETSQLEKITGDAFAGSKQIKSIYLPTGVEITATNVFQYCHGLEYVYNFENVKFNVSSLGEGVFDGTTFYECLNLKEIKLPQSIKGISGNSFRYNSLERVYIPASVTSISSEWMNNLPSKAKIFYCGGDASKLLSISNGSTGLAKRIDEGKAVSYAGLGDVYADGAVVGNANLCDIYYAGIHFEDGNPCVIICDRCSANGIPEAKPVHIESITVEYASYDQSGERITFCLNEKCPHRITEATEPLFVYLGSSSPEFVDGAIVLGFDVNTEALDNYREITGKTVKYGIFVVAESRLGENDIFDENGDAIEGALTCEISRTEVSMFDLKVSGFKTEEQKALTIAMGAYVSVTLDGKTVFSYLQGTSPVEGKKYSFISYNGFINN